MDSHLFYISFHDLILILTGFESFLLCALLYILPRKNGQSRNILAIFFFLTGGIISTTFVIWNPYLQTQPITSGVLLTSVLSACTLLQGPVLYFYFRSLSEPLDLYKRINYLHLIPTLIAIIIITVFGVDTQAWLPWNWAHLEANRMMAVSIVWGSLRCLPMLYIAACVFSEYKFRQQKREMGVSDTSSEKFFLANMVLAGFVLIEVWSLAGYFLGNYISGEANSIMGMCADYLSTLLVNLMFLYGILNTRKLFTKELVVEHKVIELPPQIAADKIYAIEKGINEEKLYLERNLNLDRFAERIGLKARDVTVVLNTHYKVNFFEFINGHRIKEAMRLLSAEGSKDDKIADIIQKSGFNSESTFVRYFKQITGVTPSEYREKYLKKHKRKETKEE